MIKDGEGTVLQRFNYYPFGSESRVWTAGTNTPQSALRYRFGGKEIAGQKVSVSTGIAAAAAGSPYLDFGARVYDPRTAAWLSQDPLSEKYYSISPYAYCAGNPVLVFDPDGRQLYVAKEYQEQFRMDLQNVFGEKTEAFYFNDDGALKLDGTKKDFLSGMTKDQRDVFKGLYKVMSDRQITSVVYADFYNLTVGEELKYIDIVQQYGGALYSPKDHLIVVSPNVKNVTVSLDQFQFSSGQVGFPTQIVQQNRTSALFHEIGERITTNRRFRGAVIDYENHVRHILGLPLRPYDLNHSNSIPTRTDK